MSVHRNESTERAREIWAVVDRVAANAPELQHSRGRALRADVGTVVGWLVDRWPGLEDGMPWPDNDHHEVIQAARRLKGQLANITGIRVRVSDPE